MLQLVPKTKAVLNQHLHSLHENFPQPEPDKLTFIDDFQEISNNLFSFWGQDFQHQLRCLLLLDLKDVFLSNEENTEVEERLLSMAVCDFPMIDSQILNEKVIGDDYLQRTIMTLFYLNILRSLINFCIQRKADGLILTVTENASRLIDLYKNFSIADVNVVTEKGIHIQMTILSDSTLYNELEDCILNVRSSFSKTLWHNQRENQAMRNYLITHAGS
ncbi:MAG: hypothetical protein FJX71_04920 [Alphaproteobacteria bacterium]|nr:hypothetical protein [Alphaproteobacteria bacterium]